MTEPSYTISSIAKLLKAHIFLVAPESTITKLVTDSRIIANAPESLFFALKSHRDGHQFINDAYQKGVRNFVVSQQVDVQLYPEANFLLVADVLSSLQELAAFHRAAFTLPIIGITGSNGKTIVKEWLYQLLASDHDVVRNPKSFNSQIGVPLSVWQINAHHNLGIFEAGISTVGEMEKLRQIIQPTIGILTNLGAAHAQGFKNKEKKLQEKLTLFKNVGMFIYSPDYVQQEALNLPIGTKVFTWSFRSNADLSIKNIIKKGNHNCITAIFDGKEITLTIPFFDQASVENIVICWATLLAMGYEQNEIAFRMQRVNPVSMRMQLVTGIENCSVIDDSYSADISSLAIALDFLNQQNQYDKKTLILSDIVESGKADAILYKEVNKLIKQKKITRLIGIGPEISANANLFDVPSKFYASTTNFVSGFSSADFNKETILVKGARKFGFEQIIKLLTQKTHVTVLDINLNALAANVQYYRSKLKPNVKLMAMVKAFSYGSGSFEIANLLQFHQVDYLAVAYADEGIALRKAGIQLPIMVMSPEPAAFEAILKYRLEPEIYNIEILNSFLHFLGNDQKDYPVHLKLDTGMHRLGFEKEDIAALLHVLSYNKSLRVISVFSHLVGSGEERFDYFTHHQLALFHQMYAQITDILSYKPFRHIANTAAISRWPAAQMDMVRLGIGMYGFDEALKGKELQTVAALRTTITQIKHLQPGETVGYSRRGVLPNGGKIATVKIGYADGYSRAFGNGIGYMLLNDSLVPTIGAICMDMTMLDITGIEAKLGDEVIVFNDELTISTLANQINTIPYEILTNVSQRVKRVYYYE